MNDTIKSVVSVASLPRPTPPPVVHHHLQIDLIMIGSAHVEVFILFPFLFRSVCGVFVCLWFFLVFFSFFFLFSSSFFWVSHSHPGHVYILLSSLRETITSHPYNNNNNNTNINNVCIARRPGLKGRAGIFFFFFLFLLFFFKTCE